MKPGKVFWKSGEGQHTLEKEWVDGLSEETVEWSF